MNTFATSSENDPRPARLAVAELLSSLYRLGLPETLKLMVGLESQSLLRNEEIYGDGQIVVQKREKP